MSSDPEQEYFSDGICEDIITGLSRYRELYVIARGSSFQFKNLSVDVTEAVRERPATMSGLTSTTAFLRTFLRFKTKPCQIVPTLVGLCAEDSRKRAATKSPENLTAYEHVLRGRYHWPDCRGSVEEEPGA